MKLSILTLSKIILPQFMQGLVVFNELPFNGSREILTCGSLIKTVKKAYQEGSGYDQEAFQGGSR